MLATKLFFPMSGEDRGLSRDTGPQSSSTPRSSACAPITSISTNATATTKHTPLEETMEALTEVVRSGKVRYLGFSEWPADRIRQAIDMAGVEKFVSSQPQYSLLHRDPEDEVIPLSAANGISQIVWSPLGQGILTGKYKPGEAARGGHPRHQRRDGRLPQGPDDPEASRSGAEA